ncbi:MAG: MFS transporter [Rubritepida sp.]|jgi:predicted MFS family arabinose efflux permease|nr:MFS transporter [Rubritepida sp.]
MLRDTALATALAGAAATCVGIGLARFAFVPLFPAMVQAGWVSGAEAGLLGAANLAGYIAGAVLAQPLGRAVGTRPALAIGMALILASLLACALPLGLGWLLAWRALAGVAGGFLMSLAGPAVQRAVPPGLRGRAAGVVVAGVGGGIALGATAVPLLLTLGVSGTWLGLAALTGLIWLAAQRRFPADAGGGPPRGAPPLLPWLLLAYALSGAGMVPHMIYLSDLAARGLGLGLLAGSLAWLAFGTGALAGTLLGGRVADRLGGARATRIWLGVQVAALLVALLAEGVWVGLAAVLGGFAGVGVSAVTLAWAREVAGEAAGALWVRCTIVYSIGQAAAAFAMAAIFGATGESHAAVFALGLALSAGALGFAFIPVAQVARRGSSSSQ